MQPQTADLAELYPGAPAWAAVSSHHARSAPATATVEARHGSGAALATRRPRLGARLTLLFPAAVLLLTPVIMIAGLLALMATVAVATSRRVGRLIRADPARRA